MENFFRNPRNKFKSGHWFTPLPFYKDDNNDVELSNRLL